MALEAWRQLKTKQNKTKTQDKSFLSLLLSKMEFSTYFVYFPTFSYKFKVQQTPSEFGLPVDGATFHDRMDNKGAAFSTPSM